MLGLIRSIWSYRLVKLALATVLLALGAAKLTNLENFAQSLAAFGLLPQGLVVPAAVVLSLLELIAALGLLGDIRGFLNLSTGLTLLWTIMAVYGLMGGLDPLADYGPKASHGSATASLAGSLRMDLILLALAAYLYIWRRLRRIRPIGIFAVSPLQDSKRAGKPKTPEN